MADDYYYKGQLTPARKRNLEKICVANFSDNMIERALAKMELIRAESLVDCVFDKTKMESQFDNTLAISKWIGYKLEYQEVLRKLNLKSDIKYRALYQEYKVDSPLKINTKEELNIFINTDENYALEHNTQTIVNNLLEYIDSIIKALHAKSWEQNRWITYQQFINGK